MPCDSGSCGDNGFERMAALAVTPMNRPVTMGDAPMPREYDNPFEASALAAATRLALAFWREEPAIPLETHCFDAVRQVYCTRIADIEDAVEGRLSGTHAAVVALVVTRAREAVAAGEFGACAAVGPD